jgi:steroid delta-isomerase-like uncharacterized protein
MDQSQITEKLIHSYVEMFNAHDSDGLINLLDDSVIHDINEGAREIGKEKFRAFKAHMDSCYSEQLKDVCYLINGNRAAIEFMCHGTYIKTDGSLPAATGQTYAIQAAAFFEVNESKISRVTSYYSLKGWIEAIS